MDASELITVVTPEPHQHQERWVTLAARGLIASGIFFHLCFIYAFFYLRSIDSNGQWQPHGVSPCQGWGAAVAGAGVLAAAALLAAHRVGRRNQRARVRLLALGLALAIATVALQIVDYTAITFGPSSGGYASVFVGWTVVQTLAVLGSAVWLEMLLAGAWRALRDDPTGDVRMTTVNVQAAALWWTFLAGAGLVVWIVLYLV